MSIPKGSILYRAQRHRESLTVNIKQGYYSSKTSISPPTTNRNRNANFHPQCQKKFSQGIYLKVYDSAVRKNEVPRTLSKFSHVTKCKIEAISKGARRESAMNVIQRVFKVLKRVKRLEIPFSGHPEGIAQTSSTLLLFLNNLESLTLSGFSYSEDHENMKFFMEAVKLASKRRSWPNLKSLRIHFQPPDLRASKPEYDDLLIRSLKQLLQFMKNLRTCQKIYECSSFELKLSPWASINSEQADLLCEIIKTGPRITSLEGCQANHFSALAQHSRHLKGASLYLHGVLQPDVDLRVLEKTPNFQELTLKDIFLEKQLLTQVKSLQSLTFLSLRLRQMPDASSSEAPDLARIISDLPYLRRLELDFPNPRCFGPLPTKIKLEKCPWLYDTFQAIGKKPRLERLSLTFLSFNFEKSGRLFKDLCLCLDNLTNLSHFKFDIMYADAVRDEEMLTFCQLLSKLTKVQDLNIQFLKDSCFSIKTYFALIDCLVKNLPLLSRLFLKINRVKMNDESYQLLSEAINKMRCLDEISLGFEGGEIESDFGLRSLAAGIRKKCVGCVDYKNRSRRYIHHF